jgi:hypothetical protein
LIWRISTNPIQRVSEEALGLQVTFVLFRTIMVELVLPGSLRIEEGILPMMGLLLPREEETPTALFPRGEERRKCCAD